MKTAWFVVLSLFTATQVCFAQIGGGAATYAGMSGSSVYRDNDNRSPAAIERAKRQRGYGEMRDDGTSTFIEASVLMNVKADEYVAVFGVSVEGQTVSDANTKMDATLGKFKQALKPLGIKDSDMFVDFVTQHRIYRYVEAEVVQGGGRTVREELAGFELKKNVSIHFKDKLLLDALLLAAAPAQIYDLIKVDYVVRDTAAVQARLAAETARILKTKAERYQALLGTRLPAAIQVVADDPSIYYPTEQYVSYTAVESENLTTLRSEDRVLRARKSRTFYFNPLTGNGFDTVINPIIIEPVVQFTSYVKVRYGTPQKPVVGGGFGGGF